MRNVKLAGAAVLALALAACSASATPERRRTGCRTEGTLTSRSSSALAVSARIRSTARIPKGPIRWVSSRPMNRFSATSR